MEVIMEEKVFAEALVEVNEVLKHTDPALTNHIPNSFKQFILHNMSKTYTFTIPEKSSFDSIKNNLKTETRSLLGLIYRNYMCSKEEKEYLLDFEKSGLSKNSRKNNLCN